MAFVKKLISLLLCLILALSLAACGKKAEETADEPSSEDVVTEAEESTEEAETTEAPEGTVKDAYYYADLYDTNVCSFSIIVDGAEHKYYFRNGGHLENWVFTEDNTDGWYYYNGLVISKDGKYAIGPDTDSFSSFCDYTANPYAGDTLTEEQQAEKKPGFLYVLNSYTPVSTNWGIFLSNDADNYDGLTCLDIDSDFSKGDAIHLFARLDLDSEDLSNGTVYVFPHQDTAAYTGEMTDELKSAAVFSANIENNGSDEAVKSVITVSDEAVEASEDGAFDLVFTYDDIIVAYTLITIK